MKSCGILWPVAGVSVSFDLLTVDELSEVLGVSEATLANWRAKKKGPAWVKVGRRVLYRREAVAEWLKRQER